MLLAWFATAALGANEIRGSVRNLTRGRPAVGDEVLLIRLDQGMPEEARATTDAHGAFTFNPQHFDRPYLVRVLHHRVDYDQRAVVGDVLSVPVFDVASQVPNVTGSIEILRTGTNGRWLHVSDMYEITNESSPPLTQVGERTFDAYLPRDAKVDSVVAAGPGKGAAMISATPVTGEPGHFTVSFPLRPGATRFAFNYDLPYEGHARFQITRAYPIRQLAIMTPLSMKFSSRPSAFETLATGEKGYQVHLVSGLKAGKGPDFEVSGAGALPPLAGQAKPPTQLEDAPSGHEAPAPSSALAKPGWEQPETSSQSLVLGLLTVVFLVICGFLIARGRAAQKTVSKSLSARQQSAAAKPHSKPSPGNGQSIRSDLRV
jgi:hypothetical protein